MEFEFQLRRNLRRWLVSATPAGAAPPQPVGREELTPGGAARASDAGPLRPPEPPPEE